MKKILVITGSIFLLVLSGCLTYEKMSVRIIFDDTEKLSGKIFVSTIGIKTSEDSLHKRQEDFNELVKMLRGDEFLLNEMQNGIYVKNRELVIEDNRLVFKYDGIFEKLGSDGDFELKNVNDEMVLYLDSDDLYANTNGKIGKDSSHTYIKWPQGTREIYWDVLLENEEDYPLITYYNEWIKTN